MIWKTLLLDRLVGTGGGGINKVSLRKPKFRHFKYPGNILANFIWKIYEDETGLVWIGSQGFGLYQYDRQKNEYQRYIIDPSDQDNQQNIIVWSALWASDNSLWVATSLNGLYHINESEGIWRNYRIEPGNPQSLQSNNIRVVYEGIDGTIWIGSNGAGLFKFNPGEETFDQFRNIPGDSTSLSLDVVFSIFQDRQGYLWVGTYGGGLNRFDPLTGEFNRFIHSPLDSTSLSNNRIRCIFEDDGGQLWLGTDHGINLMNRETGRFKAFTTRHGLPNNVVYSILPDQKGRFWISTNNGLSRFDPQNISFRNYDEEDGLQSNEFNTGAYFVSESGELFFGGINGFNIFHPDSIKENEFIPPVLITDLKLFNKSIPIEPGSVLKQHISETDRIVLNHKQNFLTFEFAALSFTNSNKNRYKYKLEGVDKNWVEARERRFADYPGLRHGKYIFRVIGSNNDGTWNEIGDNLKVVIKPPWWKTTIAYGIYLLGFILFVYAFISYRTRRLKKLSEQLEEQVVERTRQIAMQKEEIETQRDSLKDLSATKNKLFRIIAHDLKNPMTALMSISQSLSDGYIHLDESDRMEAIGQVNKAAGDLHNLLDNLLQWTSAQSGKIPFNKEKLDLSLLAHENISLAEPVAKKKKISLESDFDEAVWVEADLNMINTVLRNLLSNAIKFTPTGGQVSLSVSEIKSEDGINYIEVSVKDSGVGIPEDQLEKLFQMGNSLSTKGTENESGTGLGLLLCHDFIKKNGGEIEVVSKIGEGTTFKVYIPAIIK